jgi:hypothetical protein
MTGNLHGQEVLVFFELSRVEDGRVKRETRYGRHSENQSKMIFQGTKQCTGVRRRVEVHVMKFFAGIYETVGTEDKDSRHLRILRLLNCAAT